MTEALPRQKRGRRIAMTPEEVDEFLAVQRTARVATISGNGPHVTPLWFTWVGGALWLYSITQSRRWADLRADPRLAVLVDDGIEFLELRGVEITGTATVVGEVPRIGEHCPELAAPERSMARKYFGGDQMPYDERHGWLRVIPRNITSWDFHKIGN
jgi:Pyridoxamine 5'-phosphate oxidase